MTQPAINDINEDAGAAGYLATANRPDPLHIRQIALDHAVRLSATPSVDLLLDGARKIEAFLLGRSGSEG